MIVLKRTVAAVRLRSLHASPTSPRRMLEVSGGARLVVEDPQPSPRRVFAQVKVSKSILRRTRRYTSQCT